MLPLTSETAARVASSLPAGVRDRLEEGAAAFESMEMPDPREEDWRYVELGIDLADYSLPEGPGPAMADDPLVTPVIGDTAGRALIVDGTTVAVSGEGIVALAGADPEVWAAAGRSAVPAGLDRFAAAHQAFGSDGVVVTIPSGKAIRTPYLVEVQAVTPGALVLPRVVVAAGDGSEGSVVIVQRSPDGTDLVAVPRVEVLAGDNANVAVTAIQDWGDATTAVAHHRYAVGRDGGLVVEEAGLGGRFARLHLTFDLHGRGADAKVLGLSFGDMERTLDYRAFMNHIGPNSTSEMFLKGAVGDDARSVFTGLIRIEPEGQKTNAHQTNHNLVLTDGAEAHSVPNLEILANDVRCGHGSTVGPLDAEQRYYLMSRGLDRPAADRLQVKGFFEDVLTRYRHATLEPPLRKHLMATYAGIVQRAAS